MGSVRPLTFDTTLPPTPKVEGLLGVLGVPGPLILVDLNHEHGHLHSRGRNSSGVRRGVLHYSSPSGCGAASRKRLLRGDADTGPVQLLRRQPLLPQQGHHYHVVEGIAFAGRLAQQPLLHRGG